MARANLKWTLTDLAEATQLGRATLAYFELGQAVSAETASAIRATFEAKRVTFPKGGVAIGLRLVSEFQGPKAVVVRPQRSIATSVASRPSLKIGYDRADNS